MQSQFVEELLKSFNTQLLGMIAQLVISGLVLMSIKDFSLRVLDYLKLRYSDLGKGTEIVINGQAGNITKVGFNEVEIYLDEDRTLFMPLPNFIKSNKIVIRRMRKGREV